MVVPSPMPTVPSEQRIMTMTRVWLFIVCIDSLCGRIVGTSIKAVSTLSTRAATLVLMKAMSCCRWTCALGARTSRVWPKMKSIV